MHDNCSEFIILHCRFLVGALEFGFIMMNNKFILDAFLNAHWISVRRRGEEFEELEKIK